MSKKVKPQFWYWIVSIIAVLWNVNAVMNLIVKECQWNNVTSGEFAGLVVAAIAGLGGSLLMLFKKTLAYKLFIISVIGMLVQQGFWTFKYGNKISVIYTVLILMVDLIMIVVARMSIKKGWVS